LNIAKRLVEMHGGSIGVQSGGHGMGSRFTVRLPALLSLVAETPDIGEKAVPGARRRVLVVDDNLDGAETLNLMLQLLGNDTKVASDGVEAVAMASEFRPDVILMDIGMPRLNGYDACRQIRKLPCCERVLMVACTGWGQAADKQKSREAGFDLHMVKPVDLAVLEKLLAQVRAPIT
jgi:CheY-like chemotaxis protein